MSDKMREEFEAAVLRDWPQAQLRRCDAVSSRAGQYVDERIQHAWWGWQASRAALVIELPPEWAPVSERDEGANEMREHCVSAIEAAGLKMK